MIFKKYILLACALVCMTSEPRSQNLAQELGEIQDEYDLAGGAIALFCADSVLLAANFGSAHFEAGLSVQPTTKFRIASISKTITAMAFMQLVDDGLCSLDDDISIWLGYTVRNPYYPNTPITPRMLLSHTSTIIDGGNYDSFLSQTYSAANVPSLAELISSNGTEYSSAIYNNTSPGSYFNYSNLNFGILGTVIEAVSNVRFDALCKQRIFDPLGIDASFRIADLENIEDLGALYRKQNGQWIIQADDFQDGIPNEDYLDTYTPGTNALRFAPQGGLRISATDLATIFRVFLNAGSVDGISILSPASAEAMQAEEWTFNGSNGNNYYGLFRSWGLGLHRSTNTNNQDEILEASTVMVGHPGEAYGLVSDAYFDAERAIGLVVLINGCGTGYSTSSGSAFYTVEKDLFDLANGYLSGDDCNALVNELPEVSANSVEVFPNPAADNVVVNFAAAGLHHTTLLDITGKVMWNEVTFTEKVNISSASLPSGIYTVVADGMVFRVTIMH